MKVVVYPFDSNPYQRLLYDAMAAQDPDLRLRYLTRHSGRGALLLPVALVRARMAGYSVLHVHWPRFSVGFGGPFRRHISSAVFRLCVLVIALLQFRVVWTAHNVTSHEAETTDDWFVSRRMASLADVVIAHSSSTLAALTAGGCSFRSSAVIPHGNYDGVYPAADRPLARAQFGLTEDDFAVLFFGNIRPYKGVENLLQATKSLSAPGLTLLVAGDRASPELDSAIKASVEPARYAPRRIPDSEVGRWFAAADVVCLPFASVETSGSAVLALTFGRALVAPSMGGLAELPAGVGWLYDPSRPNALVDALREAHADREGLARRAAAARRYADSLGWASIAARTRTVLEGQVAAR